MYPEIGHSHYLGLSLYGFQCTGFKTLEMLHSPPLIYVNHFVPLFIYYTLFYYINLLRAVCLCE